MKMTLQEVMTRSGVKFGTSGARGLAVDLTDGVSAAYTRGFLQYLQGRGSWPAKGGKVAVAGDLRPSTGRIMNAVCRAVAACGGEALNCGRIPSPALALLGLEQGIPSIMVTGSHIPDDRNGIKFNKPDGEVLKEDEAGMTAQEVEIDERTLTARDETPAEPSAAGTFVPAAEGLYVRRYLEAFPDRPLHGVRIGVYQHSAVGRDVLVTILQGLGAVVEALGRSDRFIPVDTEAIRPEDIRLARQWAWEGRFDALVSADGDSDRPLIADERGEWLRGDVAGILTARFLEADSISTPVSSNSALERTGWFPEIRRTRIGSPYVVASMIAASAEGRHRVVGYEANGGFLLNSDLPLGARTLRALPTRDAMVVALGVLSLARRENKAVSQLVASLPARYTASDRLQAFDPARSQRILAMLGAEDPEGCRRWDEVFGKLVDGRFSGIDRTDGLRATFDNGEILHLRPSGNAPEFRCYAEAGSAERAADLCARCLAMLDRLTARTGPG